MNYRVIEHYHDTSCQRENDNECFICFEYKTVNDIRPINLQKQRLYLNNCICKGSVHNECLKTWFEINKTCPICRIKVIENNKATVFIYNYVPWGITIYSYTKELSLRIVRALSFVLFIYALIDFYFMIIKTRYKLYDDYNYYHIPMLDNE